MLAHRHSPLRRAIVWLIAVLLPLQVIAVTVLTALGPAHVHRPAAATARPSDVMRAFGHFHRAASPERHFHGLGDASVERRGGDTEGTSDTVSPTLLAIAALLPQATCIAPPEAEAARVVHAPWACLTHDPLHEERPPRAAHGIRFI